MKGKGGEEREGASRIGREYRRMFLVLVEDFGRVLLLERGEMP